MNWWKLSLLGMITHTGRQLFFWYFNKYIIPSRIVLTLNSTAFLVHQTGYINTKDLNV